MLGDLITAVFIIVPLLSVAFFAWAAVGYKKAKKQAEEDPTSISKEDLNFKKMLFIIAGLLFGGFAIIVVAYLALFIMAISFM